MFTLPILPPEMRIPLDPYTAKVEREIAQPDGTKTKVVAVETVFDYPGCTAVVRPVSLDEDAIWRDRYPAKGGGTRSLEATNALVKQQLLRIEGYGYQFPDGHTEPFDAKNDAHIQSMPGELRWAIYFQLRERADLTESTSGNSDSPSGSGGTTNTSTSPAEAATSEPATV